MNKQGVVFHAGFPTKTEPGDTMNSGRKKAGKQMAGSQPDCRKAIQRLPATHPSYFRETFQFFLKKFAFNINIVTRRSTRRPKIRKVKSGGKHLFSRIIRKRKT